MLYWIITFTLLGGILSALAASVFLLVPAPGRTRVLPHLVSFATGALLGAAFLALLPRAFVGTAGESVGLTVLAGLLAFFMLEKAVLWRHCHHDECEAHGPGDKQRDAASGVLVLVGDGIHNLLDGVLIAAAFLTDFHLGVVTSVAVVAHEIPQEVGDLAVLLNAGFTRRRAFTINVLASLASVLGGVVAYFWLERTQELLPFVLAVAAASFVYVAVADLIPGLHRRVDGRASLFQILLIGGGVGVIYLTRLAVH
ncbi:MAG: ZIP family metal transporter [Gammaproteobacteria bacterium]